MLISSPNLGTAIGYPGPSAPVTPIPVEISAYPAPNEPQPPILPTVLPTQPPKQISVEAQIAIEYIANHYNVSVDLIEVVSEYLVEYQLIEKQFQQVTLVNNGSEGSKVYKLMIDLADGHVEEDVYALRDAEIRSHQEHYGKLEPILYAHLQTINDDDKVPIAIWVAAKPGQTLTEQQARIFADLASEYPEAQASLERSGKPMDVSNPELARQINADYRARLIEAMTTRIQPLITELTQLGYDITTYEGMPSFKVVLPKRLIQDLSSRTNVSAIYWVDTETSVALDSAVPNSLAPNVWDRGYDGTGVTIAILERGNVDRNNTFLNHAPSTLVGVDGVQNHATWVASTAASFDATLTGMAPGATILSAGENGTPAGAVFALQWATVEQNAPVVNYSGGYVYNDNELHWFDRAFDYWARAESVLIIKSAGNSASNRISSPGRGWNVLTVGAYNDQNNLDWSDDQIWASSGYINPCGSPGDCLGREKPEVVAVGVDVEALGRNNIPATNDGTSLAAPQVAGLGALLIHRAPMLATWPEVSRAIIMASATHNIEGDSIIPDYHADDLKDGAGAINADLADTVAQNFKTPFATCSSSCWWPYSMGLEFFTEMERTFHAYQGESIRIAISWWSNPDTPGNDFSYDRLDLDLDLWVRDPNNSITAFSTSVDNNYEMVEFQAPQTGIYRIVVDRYSPYNGETTNALGIALVNTSHRIYLPTIIKN